ncbi:hypothetical protein HMPREF9336_04141 [Segniliparus rugosus ATCC BAA-974]|uniref:Uncharacterized protein n=1 Tax=Segniliparus rugosus (strain ATCC BAA-974 / DSM 45345 / CCUG 50838 / CIP 108380 / JCM 13579 / CDC 945) TaxID=679197 RepID=U1M2C7_SEGRC|nr:hypothetical protein HMPREF9336_04141 [Segniliparus rugosus ATCC BAA-974]
MVWRMGETNRYLTGEVRAHMARLRLGRRDLADALG